MKNFRFALLFVFVLLLGACAQPDDSGQQAASDGTSATLDLNGAPNKVTADDYRHEPVPVAEKSVTSVDADGNIAPFGMASREKRDVAPVPVAATAAAAQSAVYMAQCVACHGADAKGVQGLGLDLTASQLVAVSDTDALVAFLKAGRMPGDPGSVTGIPMPAFAWMPQADLEEVAAYLKTL